jgi:hypothetical protein
VFVAAATLLTSPGEAAQRSVTPSSGRPAVELGQTGTVPVPRTEETDAPQTRERLESLLEKYPPALGAVVKLDPSLLANQAYLSPYPALAAFLAQHPEIAHNPTYFLWNVRTNVLQDQRNNRSQSLEVMGAILAGLAGFSVFVVVITALGWLIRTLIDYRRWNRVSKTQTEIHTKLLDRFTANDDLLAYMQTPGGRRFLENAPIPLDSEPRTIAAPLSRILWTVQAGVILAIAGGGLQFVSGRITLDDAALPLWVAGVLAVALGVGFVVSAIVAYLLSQRLGLLEPRHAAPVPGPTPGA